MGFDASTQVPGTSPLIFTLSTGDVFTVNQPGRPNFQFVGFISDSGPITSVTIRSLTGGGPTIDNVAVGQVVAIPEPATLAVFGCLALGACGLRRRKTPATN